MKVDLARKLSSCEPKFCCKRYGTGFGKPSFPKIPDNAEMNISTFVGEDSRFFFKILRLDTEFLVKPIEGWADDPGYVAGKEVVQSLSVVNDGAERVVKLANDFLHSAHKEANLQTILQVENNRKAVPNQRKRNLSSISWYLKLE